MLCVFCGKKMERHEHSYNHGYETSVWYSCECEKSNKYNELNKKKKSLENEIYNIEKEMSALIDGSKYEKIKEENRKIENMYYTGILEH